MSDQDSADGVPVAASERRPWRRRLLRTWPFFLGLAGATLGLVLFTALDSGDDQLTEDEVQTAVASAMESTPEDVALSEVYQAILPSLVFIRTETANDGFGIGSGVVVNEDGSILTALHVVEGATEIRVTFADGTSTTAQIGDAFPDTDLAILVPDQGPELIVPAVLGGGMQIGDEAFAVGNPLGLAASLSAGVISGLEREMPVRGTEIVLEHLIQFDAAVNPGSSGGPLLNREGQVVGIVTALANPTAEDSFTGIGFAVPISAAGGAGGPPR